MSDPRDQLFEKALAHQLRADGAGESLCLDPEALAAYHERMLSPEELAAAKSHIVSCARCQEILAQLEATQEVNATRSEPEPALTTAANSAARAKTFHEESALAAVPAALASPAAMPKVTEISPKKRSALRWAAPAGAIAAGLLLWIGVREFRAPAKSSKEAVQVAENRSEPPRNEEYSHALKDLEKQKADVQPENDLRQMQPKAAASPAPSALREQRDTRNSPAIAGKLESQSKKPSAAYEYSMRTGTGMGGGRGPSAAAAQAQANNALQRGDQAVVGGAAQMDEVAPPAGLDRAEPQKRQPAPGVSAGAASGFAQPAAPPPPPVALKSVGGHLRGTVTDPSGAVIAGASVVLKAPNGGTVTSTSTDSSGTYSISGVAAGNYQLELQSPGFKTDTLTGLNVAPGDNVIDARLEIGTSAEAVEVTAQSVVLNSRATEVTAAPERKGKSLQALLLASSGLQTVASPDGKSIWKFGVMGQIVHSKNAGKDWATETSGVTVNLLAASAPSAKVCWIAGAAGTLLRTTDGGKHWQVVHTPIAGDLGGVHAADAQHASIWDAPNHISYETSDGGATWKQTANE